MKFVEKLAILTTLKSSLGIAALRIGAAMQPFPRRGQRVPQAPMLVLG
jgi:hypothetical protein